MRREGGVSRLSISIFISIDDDSRGFLFRGEAGVVKRFKATILVEKKNDACHSNDCAVHYGGLFVNFGKTIVFRVCWQDFHFPLIETRSLEDDLSVLGCSSLLLHVHRIVFLYRLGWIHFRALASVLFSILLFHFLSLIYSDKRNPVKT